jgi:ribonucleoside-diphosphate reductase subunit M1
MYYLRTRPAAQAIQFMVDQALLKDVKVKVQPPAITPKKAAEGTGILTPNSSSKNSPIQPAPGSAPASVDSAEQDICV